MTARDLRTYKLFWAPEGRCIATVRATTSRAAIHKAPRPYRRFPGEIYAEAQPQTLFDNNHGEKNHA